MEVFLQEYNEMVIMGICLMVGYMIKHSLSFIENKYIPLFMGLLGLILNVVNTIALGAPVGLETILTGLVSGLASTGVHQGVKGMEEKKSGA